MGGDKWSVAALPSPSPSPSPLRSPRHRRALSAHANVWPHCRARCRGRGATMGGPLGARWRRVGQKRGRWGGGDRTPGWHCHCPHRVTSWCGAGEGPGAQRGPQPGLCHHPSSKPPCPQRHCLSPKPPPVPKATTMSPKPPCPQSHRLSPKPPCPHSHLPSPQSHHVPKATMSPKPPPRGHRAPKATSHPRVPTCPGATTCPQSCARGRW